MRFACQSCGKAYNLPEEKIAEKSNVKLKCRVCGAIVEVKRQGEIVAHILDDGEGKRGRVSEAPAPLTSILPDEADEATQAIAVTDAGLPFLPAPAATGFGSSSMASNPAPVPPPLGGDGKSAVDGAPPLPAAASFSSSVGEAGGSGAAAPPPMAVPAPPPLAVSAPLPPPPLRSPPHSSAPPPPPAAAPAAPELPLRNGTAMSNGSGYHVPAEFAPPPPGASGIAAAVAPVPEVAPAELAAPAPAEPRGEGLHSNAMLAATFLTGVLIGVIIAFTFF